MNTALQLDKELKLSKIFGSSDKAKALNYYSEAIGYYDNKIKIMWSDKKKTQGPLLYFSATGFKTWQNLGKLRGYDLSFINLLKFMTTKKARFTRLDVAIDVIDGDLTADALHQKLQTKQVLILDSLKGSYLLNIKSFLDQIRLLLELRAVRALVITSYVVMIKN